MSGGAVFYFFACECVQIWIRLPADASDNEGSFCFDVSVSRRHIQPGDERASF